MIFILGDLFSLLNISHSQQIDPHISTLIMTLSLTFLLFHVVFISNYSKYACASFVCLVRVSISIPNILLACDLRSIAGNFVCLAQIELANWAEEEKFKFPGQQTSSCIRSCKKSMTNSKQEYAQSRITGNDQNIQIRKRHKFKFKLARRLISKFSKIPKWMALWHIGPTHYFHWFLIVFSVIPSHYNFHLLFCINSFKIS